MGFVGGGGEGGLRGWGYVDVVVEFVARFYVFDLKEKLQSKYYFSVLKM